MRSSCRAALVVFAICAALSPGLLSRASDPAPSTANLGKKIANVAFTNSAGKQVVLYDLKGKKATVVVFLSFECPVSNSYCPSLAEMAEEFGKSDVAFVALTTNPDEDAAQVEKQARSYKVPFPVLRDARLAAADAFKAEFTPEAFLLDEDYVLRYRGRIDDSFYARLKRNHNAQSQDLRQALGELLSGRPIREPATLAVGCPIPREAPAVEPKRTVTYHRDVLPILQDNCQNCHRPGEVGPFSLMTYRQAVNWATDIKQFTQNRQMPPWKPVDGPAFHNERRLSDRDIATLAAWVDGNTPEGDPKDAPAPKKFPEGWQLGTPDLVLTVPADFQLDAAGSDVFRCFVLPTNLTEDKHVAAVEVRPGNPRIVHHMLLFVDSKGQGRALEKKEQERKKPAVDPQHPGGVVRNDIGPGYSVTMGVGFRPEGGLSGWAPGNVPRYLPQGTGYFLPKGSDVIMQVHYHRNGKVEKDRSMIGLYFAKKPVEKLYQGAAIAGGTGGQGVLRMFFTIPPGAENFELKGSLWATQDCTLYTVMPHMHMLGKDVKVTMTPPDGPAKTLVTIGEWDYNWQETYIFKEPIRVKAGTRFDVAAHYDNSANNPRNPFNPPRPVVFGEQTTNEMCFIFFGGTSDRPGRQLPMTFEPPGKGGKRAALTK
jgi:peroxiredoxin